VVGVCVALDEVVQGDNHIRAALTFDATPSEVREVILQSTIYAGMPRCLRAAAILERVLEEQGRIAEFTETQLPLPSGTGPAGYPYSPRFAARALRYRLRFSRDATAEATHTHAQ